MLPAAMVISLLKDAAAPSAFKFALCQRAEHAHALHQRRDRISDSGRLRQYASIPL